MKKLEGIVITALSVVIAMMLVTYVGKSRVIVGTLPPTGQGPGPVFDLSGVQAKSLEPCKLGEISPCVLNYGGFKPLYCPTEHSCMATDAIVFGEGKILGYHSGNGKWYDYDGKEIK